ncbi:MAG: RcnB family protein [Pseudomonadota bacterium]
MKSKAIVCAIAAASLGFGSLSFAQGYDGRGPRGEPPRVEQRGPGGPQAHAPRGFDRRDVRDHRGYNAGAPQFHRGGYIPHEYRGRQYVVNDWRARHLNAPPPGQQWVQAGGDYALIAIATGLIAQLVLR